MGLANARRAEEDARISRQIRGARWTLSEPNNVVWARFSVVPFCDDTPSASFFGAAGRFSRVMADAQELSILGLTPGTLVWGQLGKNWWPGRVRSQEFSCSRALVAGSSTWRTPLSFPKKNAMRATRGNLCEPDSVLLRNCWQHLLTRLPSRLQLGGE